MNIHFLLWLMLIVPWFSLILTDVRSMKRYAPTVILSCFINTVVQEMAYAGQWWENMDKIVPWGFITNVSLIYGFFAIATYWILYFSYGTLWAYLLINAVIDGVWLMFVPQVLQRMGLFRFVNLNAWLLFLICIAIALVLYAYQAWQEGIYKAETGRKDNDFLKRLMRRVMGERESAR